MTASILTQQPKHNCIQIMTDAAMYSDEVGVIGFINKVQALPHLPAIVTGVGASNPILAISSALALELSWDNFRDNAPEVLPRLVACCDPSIGAHVLVAGISETVGPEAFIFRIGNTLPVTQSRDEVEKSPFWCKKPGELVRLPNVITSPPAVPVDIIAANYEGIDPDDDPDVVAWSMLKVIEMQRQLAWSIGIGRIGGFAMLTRIDQRGITQRVVKRWPDVAFAGDIFPTPIDWRQWHLDNPKPGTLSRLKRSMSERKAIKRSVPLHLVQS